MYKQLTVALFAFACFGLSAQEADNGVTTMEKETTMDMEQVNGEVVTQDESDNKDAEPEVEVAAGDVELSTETE